MIRIDREQMICVGALGLLLLSCILAVSLSLQARSDAANELTERRETFSRLESRARASNAGARSTGVSPPAAFLEASTMGVAAAQLQAYLSQAAASHRATLISYGAEPARREDAPDAVRVQATLEIGQNALQALLYQLESQTPYVFVDAMTLQPPTGTRAVTDPILRVTLSMHALWRRGPA